GRSVGGRERVAVPRAGGGRGPGALGHDVDRAGASPRPGARRGALQPPPAARLREPEVRSRGSARGTTGRAFGWRRGGCRCRGVAGPVRDAQALVAGQRGAVIRRLLGYLLPYRRRLGIGMGAAALITLVSLIPPYLAGYLIDRVIRPAQEGVVPAARAGVIAAI